MLSSMFMSCLLLGTRPYTTRFTNWLEVFNEVMILLVANLTIANVALTNPLERQANGYVLLWVIRFDIGVNLVIIIGIQAKKVYFYFKMLQDKYTARKMRR